MTTGRQPTAGDIRALVSFLPKLYDDRAPPLARWTPQTKTEDGLLLLPWPEYNKTVEEFINLIVAQGCWMDADYDPERESARLADEAAITAATIPEVQGMLTALVRGERFCDGWWEAMIEEGHVGLLLRRLAEIEREGIADDPEASRRRSSTFVV